MIEPSTAPDPRTAPGLRSGPVPRSVVAAALAIVVLMIVAVVVAVALPRPETTYPAGTPEATFQAFYAAWQERDLEAAYGRFSTDVRAGMSLADYRQMDAAMAWVRDQDRRVVLTDSRVTGDRATLDIRVDAFTSGMFGGERQSTEQTIPLVREDGTWRIDEGLLGVESIGYLGAS